VCAATSLLTLACGYRWSTPVPLTRGLSAVTANQGVDVSGGRVTKAIELLPALQVFVLSALCSRHDAVGVVYAATLGAERWLGHGGQVITVACLCHTSCARPVRAAFSKAENTCCRDRYRWPTLQQTSWWPSRNARLPGTMLRRSHATPTFGCDCRMAHHSFLQVCRASASSCTDAVAD
jgi:hypothetical protein